MGNLITIPAAFFWDHEERDLPTPSVISTKGKRLVVCADDPAMPELLSDARYYAEDGNDAPFWLKRAAVALLKSIPS